MSYPKLDYKILFEDYNNQEEIKVEGISFSNVSIWLFARKRAYAKYREKFAPERLKFQVNNNFYLDFAKINMCANRSGVKRRRRLKNLVFFCSLTSHFETHCKGNQ